ncbi:hypothetical protein Moror_4584 [Moniliophthora roreri MCA 2997]|uniref:Uncharacterized protein n=1 Tax=Moniliophthora roreri (strain MCA 2997) TaxID=1381753 RepID=V2YL04_MONRO|nr:hypothetical protein Moror_4584 [Moniliophthora roreri MCA 2997]
MGDWIYLFQECSACAALLSTSRISVDVNADYVPGAGQKKVSMTLDEGIERVEAMVFLDKMQAVAGFQNDLEAIKVVARYANVRLFSFVPKDK